MTSSHKRLALGAALLGVMAAAVYLLRDGGSDRAALPQVVVPRAPEPLSELTRAAAEKASPSSSAVAACMDQRLEVQAQGKLEPACFGKTHVTQNGSVRTYQVETALGTRRTLRVDASGSLILKATLIQDAATYHCEGADCKGLSLSKRDAEGARTLSFTHTELGPEEQRLVLDGQLRISADALVPALACSDQGVSIITSDGSSNTFCPKGGAGFELGNDGQRTYRFTSLDNESVLVVVDSGHRLRRVEYQSDAVLACERASCDRVQIAAPNAAGERVFTFAGTTLLESRSGAVNAVLNGTLVAPPL